MWGRFLLGQSGQDLRTQYIFIKYTESDYWPGVCKQANLSSGQRYVGPFPLFQAPLCSIFFWTGGLPIDVDHIEKVKREKRLQLKNWRQERKKQIAVGYAEYWAPILWKKINCDWVKHRPLSYMKHWLIHNSANKQRPSVRRVLDVP